MTNNQLTAHNLRYKKKLKCIKRQIKELIFENAALCDQVALVQENILFVKEERRFFLKKLMECEGEPNFSDSILNVRKVRKKRNNSEASPKSNVKSLAERRKTLPTLSSATKMATSSNPSNDSFSMDASDQQRLPLALGTLTIHCLGEIVTDRPAFHHEHWIYPLNYIATRVYGHPKDPEKKCVYTCKITDDGDAPLFELIPDGDQSQAIVAASPDMCHTRLMHMMHNFRPTEFRPQGAWFFGLAHPVVVGRLQNNVAISQCDSFKGFKAEVFSMDADNDPSINYDALLGQAAPKPTSVYHMLPEVKDEPPDELLDFQSEPDGFETFATKLED